MVQEKKGNGADRLNMLAAVGEKEKNQCNSQKDTELRDSVCCIIKLSIYICRQNGLMIQT